MIVEIDPATGLAVRAAPRPYPFGPTTIATMLDRPVTRTPDHLALIDEDRSWTYAELAAEVDRAAAALGSLGVGPGDRVAWSLPNCAELPIGFLATQRLGAIWLGVNLPLAPPEKRHLLDDAEVDLYIATPGAVAEVEGSGVSAVTERDWVAAVGAADPHGVHHPTIDPHAPAAIAYTSGTTGHPKGAVHSQHNLLWPGLVTIDIHPPTPADRQGTPLAHTILNMMVLGVVSAWARGTTGVVLRRGDADGFAADVSRHRLTRTTLVPTQVHDLVHSPDIDPADLASLELIIVGGAGTPAPTRRAFRERYGKRALIGYGLSEAPSGIVRESADEPIHDVAAGYPMAPFELVIVDDDDHPVGAGTEGEICVRATSDGPWAGCWTPTLGYWKQPDATREVLRGGMLHTGDVGALDDRGRLTISGRRSELILRGGANVYPVEVETVLALHPHVAAVAVLGVDDERLGQRVAAVITSTAHEPDTDAIRAHCAQQLAAYKVPDAIAVVDHMPRNAMGKIQKARLVAAAASAVARRM